MQGKKLAADGIIYDKQVLQKVFVFLLTRIISK